MFTNNGDTSPRSYVSLHPISDRTHRTKLHSIEQKPEKLYWLHSSLATGCCGNVVVEAVAGALVVGEDVIVVDEEILSETWTMMARYCSQDRYKIEGRTDPF